MRGAGEGATRVNREAHAFSDLTASQIAARKKAAYAVKFYTTCARVGVHVLVAPAEGWPSG